MEREEVKWNDKPMEGSMTSESQPNTDELSVKFTGSALDEVRRLAQTLALSEKDTAALAMRILGDAVAAEVVGPEHTRGHRPADPLDYQRSWVPYFRLSYVVQSISPLSRITKLTIEDLDGHRKSVDWQKDYLKNSELTW